MPQPTLFRLRRLALLFLLVAFAGCGRIAFFSDRYDNFTAYYNTFYNAEKAYTEGIDALEQTVQPVNRQVYVSIFEAPGQSTNDQRFQAAIDKSADVLRDHPDSKWVDDALLLIGKSYFYQQNFVGAEQKFREVIEMASPLEDEARLWLARTLIAAGAHDEAREHLLVSLNREELSKRWEPSLHLALGELNVKRADFDAAIEELVEGLESVRDNQYRARASFLLGQVYETVGRYEDAVAAYEHVLDAHPRYEQSYAALYSAVRVQGLHVNADEALRKLRRMERDDKNYSNRFELAYLRGRIYQSQEYADDARSLYHEILYDSDGQITDLRGRVHYALAELFRDSYQDYETASAHFDTARTALQTAPPGSGSGSGRSSDIDYAPEAITDAEDQSEIFGSFADVRAQLAEMDSLLYLGGLDDEQFTAKILEIRKQLADVMAEEERRAARRQAERGFQNAAVSGGADRNAGASNAAAAASGSAGFLFHRDPVRVQEGRMNFLARWGDRPLAPNWRRIDAIQNVASIADSVGLLRGRKLTDLDPSVGENPLPPVDYSNVPRDSLSQAAMRARRAAARYELANVLFLLMNRPDSAATWYRTVIEEDAEFPVAQRAFYALAEVHSSLGDTLAARRLYEQVLEDYPSSDFAGRVRERLGIRDDVPSDTLALAEEDYNRAYHRWRRGSYQDALDHMVEVAASYPRMEVAPRALLAAGHIYMEWAQRDSMDVFGPIPLSVPDSVLGSAGLLGISDDVSPDAELSPAGDSTTVPTTPGNMATEQTSPQDPSSGAGSAELDAKRSATPAKDRSDVLPVVDEPDRPPSKGRGTEVPRKGGTGDISGEDRPASDIPPHGEMRAADSTSLQQPPDVLTPLQEMPDASPKSMPADSAGQSLPPDSPREPAASDTGLLADSLAGSGQPAHADSLLADEAPAAAGATAAADSAARDADDTALFSGDSTAVATADTTASGLMAAAIEDDDIYLKTLYAGVRKHYPETAYAEQAERLLKALQDRESELAAAADSIAAVASAAADSLARLVAADGLNADSLVTGRDSLFVAADSTVAADGLGSAADSTLADDGLAAAADTTVAADRLATAADTTAGADTNAAADTADAADSPGAAESVAPQLDTAAVAEDAIVETAPSDGAAADPKGEIPTGEDAILGEGGIRKELGGYTLVLGRDTNEATIRALARKYADRGFRTDVISERVADQTIHRAALGHFASQQEAGVLLQKYLTQVEESVHLAPLSDFD